MIIRIRDDDVIGRDPRYDALGRFRQIHEWLKEHDAFVHVPAILTYDLRRFPEAIEYMKPEVDSGKMIPEIHGWKHIDYGHRPRARVRKHLQYCKYWIHKTFGYMPTTWYTPWGAGDAPGQKYMWEVAAEENLKLVTTSNVSKLSGRDGVIDRLQRGTPIEFLDGIEIFMHYWEGGSRLKRVVECVKHGSWEEAKKANRKLFRG